MTIRFCTYTLPLRLSALPLNEGKPMQANVRANLGKALNYVMNFLSLKGDLPDCVSQAGMSTDRGVER